MKVSRSVDMDGMNKDPVQGGGYKLMVSWIERRAVRKM